MDIEYYEDNEKAIRGLLAMGLTSRDFVFMDNRDGKGGFISDWFSDRTQPTKAEVYAAADAA